MDLYDVKGRGPHSPLNDREIGRLYRAGVLNGRHPCKPCGEAAWRTIDQLFPVLRYEASAPPFRFEEARAFRGSFRYAAVVLVLVLFGLGLLYLHSGSTAPTGTREREFHDAAVVHVQAHEPPLKVATEDAVRLTAPRVAVGRNQIR
ncbi:MAG TPA: hypothetical protein VGF73_00290 [Chthoniobacterales bacterium]